MFIVENLENKKAEEIIIPTFIKPLLTFAEIFSSYI